VSLECSGSKERSPTARRQAGRINLVPALKCANSLPSTAGCGIVGWAGGVHMRIVVLCALGALLAACAGRDPMPVATSQMQDTYATCAQIQAEIQANNTKVQELADEQGLKVAQNVAAGVAGVFIWPIWFAMDFKGAASKDVAALQARQQYLAVLASERCASPPAGQPPTRRGRQAPQAYAAPPPVPPAERLPPSAYYQPPPTPEPSPQRDYGTAN